MDRQIRALTERDPVETASMNYLQGDGPWYYGVRTKDGWVVPGFAPDSVVLTERMFPVRIISWTGEAGKGARYEALDRAAVEYATKYNQRMDVILCTN